MAHAGAPASETIIDVVTPTFNRPKELIKQAKHVAPQLGPRDRWIIVDDCSTASWNLGAFLEAFEAAGGDRTQIEIIGRRYCRGDQLGTIQATRHLGCSAARADALIVEVDDHDLLHPGALTAIRQAFDEQRGVLIYGQVRWVAEGGEIGDTSEKPPHVPWMLRDSHCPTEGVRAFPKRLYRDVDGYRWEGRVGFVNECEFPAGDYGLFLRMEQKLDGGGFYCLPDVLCDVVKAIGSISTRHVGKQQEMAIKLRRAAKAGLLKVEPLSESLEAVAQAEGN